MRTEGAIRVMLKNFRMKIKRRGPRATYQRLNQMIDDAMDGTFSEQDYDETEISKLEAKWKRFLASSKLSNQKLEEERKNIKELVSDISHQTKTPLANILLYSQLLEEQNLDENSKKLVEEIVKQSEKLDFLIQSLVKTSRLETGTFQFQTHQQDIFPMLQEVEEQASVKAKRKNMQISIQTPENEIQAVFDKKWTSEAIYNMLDNAVKYGNENSQVQISIQAYEMFVAINILNEGKSISEEEIPRIFHRFYRGKNASEEEGVGIGLYLARQIIEEQGGYIKVISKENTTFSVYLPKNK